MILESLGEVDAACAPLKLIQRPEPILTSGEILIRITRCGVCHTELDIIEGRTPPPKLPVILGHQIVGIVEECSGDFSRITTTEVVTTGARVGVAWIASACGECDFCKSGRENLCPHFQATGRDVDGGYAEYVKIRVEFAHPIPASVSDAEAAPLLCAGAIGYRSLRLSNLQDGQALGLMGFGGSNHLVLKLAGHKFPKSKIYVFSRNPQECEFALALGAEWAGAINKIPPAALDAIIDTTPVWTPDLEALKILKAGGRLVINAIRKEEKDKDALLQLNYPEHLWLEKEIKSVANVTRDDVHEFLQIAAAANIKPEFQEYELKDANRALLEMKQGRIHGSKVLTIS